MARIKAAKVVPCQTRAEFEETVDAIAKMAVDKEKLVAALKADAVQGVIMMVGVILMIVFVVRRDAVGGLSTGLSKLSDVPNGL